MARVTDRKSFVLRLEPKTLDALRTWAADELRSVNGQIEYLLRHALRDAGRLPANSRPAGRGLAKVDKAPETTEMLTGNEKKQAGRRNRTELAVGAGE